MRIMYVEDNMVNLALVQRIARMGGHEVVSYSDGVKALEALQDDDANLILMDIELDGELDGTEVVQKLRERGDKRPIVAVTAYAMAGDMERIMAAGCDGYLPKPVPIAELLEIIAKYDPENEQPDVARAEEEQPTPLSTALRVSSDVGEPLRTLADPKPATEKEGQTSLSEEKPSQTTSAGNPIGDLAAGINKSTAEATATPLPTEPAVTSSSDSEKAVQETSIVTETALNTEPTKPDKPEKSNEAATTPPSDAEPLVAPQGNTDTQPATTDADDARKEHTAAVPEDEQQHKSQPEEQHERERKLHFTVEQHHRATEQSPREEASNSEKTH